MQPLHEMPVVIEIIFQLLYDNLPFVSMLRSALVQDHFLPDDYTTLQSDKLSSILDKPALLLS